RAAGPDASRYAQDDLFHQGLRHSHRIDRIDGLIGAQGNDLGDAVLDGRVDDVVATDNVRHDGLHGEELARRYLLQGGCMKHVVHAFHDRVYARPVAHVADVKLHAAVVELVAHHVLLQLVATEDPNFTERAFQQELQQLVPERARAPGDQYRLSAEVVHAR